MCWRSFNVTLPLWSAHEAFFLPHLLDFRLVVFATHPKRRSLSALEVGSSCKFPAPAAAVPCSKGAQSDESGAETLRMAMSHSLVYVVTACTCLHMRPGNGQVHDCVPKSTRYLYLTSDAAVAPTCERSARQYHNDIYRDERYLPNTADLDSQRSTHFPWIEHLVAWDHPQ